MSAGDRSEPDSGQIMDDVSTKGHFDYDAALRRLIQLRFEARLRGERSTSEIRFLEREIYAHVRSSEPVSEETRPGIKKTA